MIKIHIFLDHFQGCYKPNMRFFAGLYFLFRFFVIASRLFCYTLLQRLVVQQIICTLMILLLTLCQPYRKNFLNYVDPLIFTSLALLNSLSLYLLEVFKENEELDPPYFVFGVQVVLMFLPLFYAVSYMAACKEMQKKFSAGI